MPRLRILLLLAVMLTVITPVHAQSTFSDDFSSGNYLGSTGSASWLTPWTESGESDGPGSGDVRITSSGGQDLLRLKDDTRGIQRGLSHAEQDVATRSYIYR